MSGLWLKEFWRLAAILTAALLFSLIFGHTHAFITGGLLGWFLWHACKISRFARWLITGQEPVPSYGNDLWGELYYQVHKLKNQTRRREQMLREVVEQYRASAEALPDATLVLTPDNQIEWMNQSAASLFGLDVVTDIGHRVQNLIRHPDFIAMLNSGDYSEPLEMNSPTDDGRVMEIHIVPYGNRQRLLVARDITRLHQLEVIRRDFIANVSHELSTPLTVISGYLENLSGTQRKPEQLEHALSQMRQQSGRMRNLLNDLLQISRLELNETQEQETEVDVASMLSSLVEELKLPGQPRNHEITLQVDEDLRLRGIGKDLYSAFSNLIRNAVQYTPDGGRIGIRWFAEQGAAIFSVQDTGIGVPQELIPRLTERFYRVDAGRSRSLGGTGLGLSIVKHVLRNHQATLHIESAVGKGSLFQCRFPAGRAILPSGRQQAV